MAVVTKQIREGDHYSFRLLAVAERNENGRLHCPTLELFESAEKDHPDALVKLTALLDLTAEDGPPKNIEKFRNLGDGIFEFKSNPLRLLCFQDADRHIICVNGCVKKRQKTPSEVIATAKALKQLYDNAKSANKLSHEPEHEK